MSTLDNPGGHPSETEVSFWPTVTRYALIASFAMVLYTLIGNMTGLNVPAGWGKMILSFFLSIGISIAVVVLPVRHHRNEELGGFISFGRAFTVGFLVLLIAAIVNALFQYFYVSVIDPNYLNDMAVKMVEFYGEMGLPEDALEEMMNQMESATSFDTLKQGLIGGVLITIILSLIVAAIMKRAPVQHLE